MKIHLIALAILVLFFSNSLVATTFSADTSMTVESVTAKQLEVPVLKGKETNPVLQIIIKTSGKTKPFALTEISFQISGDNIKSDIQEVGCFYSGDKPFLRDGILFGSSEKPQKNQNITGHQELVEGTNVFWITLKLKESANILNQVGATCNSIKIGSKIIVPEKSSEPTPQRLGIALRKHNDDNVDTYRIPGLATTNQGTLIAVYDIRHNSAADLQEDIDIGMNRSTDGGRTWESMKVIMDMGKWGGKPQIENGIGDPAVLVDRQTNTIWVAAVWAHGHPGKRNWWASKQGIKPEETSQFVLVKSEDDGKTWSEPINITSQIKNSEWYLLLQGPGKGITLKDGTLIFPAQFKDKEQMPYSTIIWSKDHGETWHIGTGAKPNTTEAQVIELDNGDLMLNMRDNRNRTDPSETNGRSVYITKNLGETWEKHPTSRTNALQESTCQASIIKETFIVNGEERELVLFSNPNTKKGRHHMTIKASLDDGQTWPVEYQLLIDAGSGRGYSCMSKIDDYTVGILYEGSQADMTFQAIPVKEILKTGQSLNYLFESGQEGYGCFRIPATVTTNSGTILAFAEGRKNGCSDTGNIDMVMKRSNDDGKTWSPLQVIWDDGENVCGNPAPVVDLETGEIHLLITWNLGEDHENEIIKQESKDTRRVFVTSSSNDGKTWSTPKEITSTTKEENWTWYATGPCHGIQLKYGNNNGRLIIPCDHIEAETKKHFSHIIFSDDHGKTWQPGGTTPQDQVNECTVAELADGTLVLNMRNYDRTQKARKISFSNDGGKTWGDLKSDTLLIEPICQASLISVNEGNMLFFLNPSSENSRSNIQLKFSVDQGKNWEVKSVIFAGPSAYSDLTQINIKTLGCLFEAGWKHPYEGIIFKKIQINEY